MLWAIRLKCRNMGVQTGLSGLRRHGLQICQSQAVNAETRPILLQYARYAPADVDYVTMGGPDEATYYVNEFGPAWRRTPGAVEWLVKITSTLPPKQRTQPVGH